MNEDKPEPPPRPSLTEAALLYAAAVNSDPTSRVADAEAQLHDAAYAKRNPNAGRRWPLEMLPEEEFPILRSFLEKNTSPEKKGGFGHAVMMLLNEVEAGREFQDRLGVIYDEYEALRTGPQKTIPFCAYCEEKLDGSQIADHVRQCEKNPMVQEIEGLKARVAGLRADDDEGLGVLGLKDGEMLSEAAGRVIAELRTQAEDGER